MATSILSASQESNFYKITRKLLQNVFCIDSAHFFRSGQKVSVAIKSWIQVDTFLVPKDMSSSY